MLETASIPVVEIMDSISPSIEQSVGFDNFLAAKDMTEAMLGKGCKNIVYLAARMDERTRQKMSGFNQAMCNADIEPLALQTEDASSFTLGAKLLGEALEKYPKLDGIFCTNDDLAIGAFYECVRRNIPVPARVSIAGFHGHDISQAMTPRLATVVTPREKIGQVAAEQIVQRLKGEKDYQPCIDLGYKIDLGESV